MPGRNLYLSQQFPSLTSVFANIRNPRRKSSALFPEGFGYWYIVVFEDVTVGVELMPVVPLTLVDIPRLDASLLE